MRRRVILGLALLSIGAVAATLVFQGAAAGNANAWAVEATQIAALSDRGLRGEGVRIAILDTGIDVTHPGLRHLHNGRIHDGELREYRSFIGGPDPADQSGHGTFIAGLLAGASDENLLLASGIEGLTPGAGLYIGRICASGDCSLYTLRDGLSWALGLDVDIISLSVGFTPEELQGREGLMESLRGLLAQAEARGVLIVAAAGNGTHPLFPAGEPNVLAVGALGTGFEPMEKAPCLAHADLLAPGQDIRGPGLDGSMVRMRGSSVAVPFAVAAAALVMEAAPELEAADMRHALISSARPVAGGCAGLLQADSALDWIRQP
ncbi:MAG: S8 family peptidase [Thermoplasmatota archaeon]